MNQSLGMFDELVTGLVDFFSFKQRCDFCNDEKRLDDEPLRKYGTRFSGEDRMYCSHCVDWWESHG